MEFPFGLKVVFSFLSPLTIDVSIFLWQYDGIAVDETGHRCQSTQGDFGESRGGYSAPSAETPQNESRLSIRVHVATSGFCQLHPIGSEIF